ncbi:MAG: terminase [Thermodesulfobacteriota bacterium]
MKRINKNKSEKKLLEDLVGFYDDPAGFVRYAFEWGRGRLVAEEGPDKWQEEVLLELGRASVRAAPLGLPADGLGPAKPGGAAATQIAVASGHGVGKTALIAWIILWFMSTRAHPQIVVTANTRVQLETKTWRELAKWHKLSINAHWFEWTASRFYNVEHRDTWFASAIPWNRERPEAFAGTHERDVLVVFDEGSRIPDEIWEVTEGAMTQPGAFWVVFGNPTQNTGRFAQCFKRLRHRWSTRQIDARACKMANQDQISQWLEDYGEDSDFVRVRVRGLFPRAATNQLIALDLVEAAAGRSLHPASQLHAAKVLGVDVARYGEDQSVLVRRQGLAATGLKKFRGLDTMTLAGLAAGEIEAWRPDAVFIDEVGIGAGVVDRLLQLGFQVIPVNGGARALDDNRYHNLRAEMWDKMRAWLEGGASIPDDQELKDDLIGPEYYFDQRERIQLEKKEDMKRRGLASPDCADALALTFARPVRPWRGERPRQALTEYDVLEGV